MFFIDCPFWRNGGSRLCAKKKIGSPTPKGCTNPGGIGLSCCSLFFFEIYFSNDGSPTTFLIRFAILKQSLAKSSPHSFSPNGGSHRYCSPLSRIYTCASSSICLSFFPITIIMALFVNGFIYHSLSSFMLLFTTTSNSALTAFLIVG